MNHPGQRPLPMQAVKNEVCLSQLLIILILVVSASVTTAGQIQTHKIRHVADIVSDSAVSLSLPSDIIVVEERVYVVDGGNHRVVAFDRSGKQLFTFGTQGSGKGEMNGPVGIGADGAGKIYIADRGNNRIQVFNRDGKLLRSIMIKVDGKHVRPIDVAVTPDGSTLFVTGNNNHSVMVFNQKGKFLRKWGGSGAENGQFRYPATIVLTNDKRVVVVDVLNTRVQVFEESGEFITSIGGWGVLPGQLVRPKGVVVDKKGRFVISDSYMEIVQVFDDAGRFLYVLGENDKPYRMTSPAGITVDDMGRLYVAEMLDNKVSIYELGQ